ncbi:AAA family ATPase [Variovorax sp. E3]|uniref:AAA family ATPase n=1 Tax=Variovorax sp. E3 TaxID=1914993 RepID=UPI0018DD9A0B|nr:AAA family ATPase [Variovorax sp. E3]
MNTTTQKTQPSVYTQQDLEKAAMVVGWLERNNQSRAWLAKKASMSGGTVSQVLAGKYPSSPSKQLNQLVSVLDTETERLADGTPDYVKGSVHKLLQVVCDRTRKHQNFGVITGYVGVGKSRFCVEYQKGNPLTLLVEVSPSMSPGVFMAELLEKLNIAVPAGLSAKFKEIKRVLKGTNYLILVDEAEKMSASALEYLRRIRDTAKVGVVLVGTEGLTSLIKPQHGQFQQIRSRVGMWPKTIESITRDDADDIVRTSLADAGELPDDLLEVLWAYCDGSARVLTENLLPALRDFGIARGTKLSAELMHSIAAKVLFMERPSAQGGK